MVVPPVWLNWPLFVKLPNRLRFELVVKVVGGSIEKLSFTVSAFVTDFVPPPEKTIFLKVFGVAGKA